MVRNRTCKEQEKIKSIDNKESVVQDLEKYYEEILLPEALTYGMTEKEFWDKDPSLMWSYRISFIQKQEILTDHNNQLAYFTGLYVRSSIASTIGNQFSKGAKIEYSNMIDLEVIRKKIKNNKGKSESEIQRQELEDSLRKQFESLNVPLKK